MPPIPFVALVYEQDGVEVVEGNLVWPLVGHRASQEVEEASIKALAEIQRCKALICVSR